MRSHLLRMRLGMVTQMAIVIEFYVSEKVRKQSGKWISPEHAEGSFRFPHPKRGRHDMTSLHLVRTPAGSERLL